MMANGMNTREERVKQLELIAESIKVRAEDIIGDSYFCQGWEITIRMYPQEFPSVKVEKYLLPHKLLEADVKVM